MNERLTQSKTCSLTIALALAGILTVPLVGAGWEIAEKGHNGPFEGKPDLTLASNEEAHEDEVDWTLARTEAEEDETDWTLAKQDGTQEEEEVDWTLAKTEAEEDETDWTLA